MSSLSGHFIKFYIETWIVCELINCHQIFNIKSTLDILLIIIYNPQTLEITDSKHNLLLKNYKYLLKVLLLSF